MKTKTQCKAWIRTRNWFPKLMELYQPVWMNDSVPDPDTVDWDDTQNCRTWDIMCERLDQGDFISGTHYGITYNTEWNTINNKYLKWMNQD